jgi:hypothetical protein
MGSFEKYIGNLYLGNRLYLLGGCCIVMFIVSFFVPGLLILPKALLLFFIILTLVDYFFLFVLSRAPSAKRITAERFSNGDDNRVVLQVTNTMRFQ